MSKSYKSPKIFVKDSRIQGSGIFAKELIKKDEIFAIKNGSIISQDLLDKMGDRLISACLQIDNDFFIGPKDEAEFDDSMVGFNHSCEPNGGFRGNIVAVAMRDIQPGEEITQDYAIFNTSQFKDFKCNCGSKKCRKIITPNDWENTELQNIYGKYFSQYILDKIKNESII